MLAFRGRVCDPNQLIHGNFARTFRLGVDLGAHRGLSRQLKTSIFLVRGAQNRTLDDTEGKRSEDSVLSGSACLPYHAKCDFEHLSAAKYLFLGVGLVTQINRLTQDRARLFRLGVDFGAQGGLSRQLKTSIFLVRGAQNRTLDDMEGKRCEDSVLNGSACITYRAKCDFEHPSAAKCLLLGVG